MVIKMRLCVTIKPAHSPLTTQKDEGALFVLKSLPTSGLALKVVRSPRTIGPQMNAVKVKVAEAN